MTLADLFGSNESPPVNTTAELMASRDPMRRPGLYADTPVDARMQAMAGKDIADRNRLAENIMTGTSYPIELLASAGGMGAVPGKVPVITKPSFGQQKMQGMGPRSNADLTHGLREQPLDVAGMRAKGWIIGDEQPGQFEIINKKTGQVEGRVHTLYDPHTKEIFIDNIYHAKMFSPEYLDYLRHSGGSSADKLQMLQHLIGRTGLAGGLKDLALKYPDAVKVKGYRVSGTGDPAHKNESSTEGGRLTSISLGPVRKMIDRLNREDINVQAAAQPPKPFLTMASERLYNSVKGTVLGEVLAGPRAQGDPNAQNPGVMDMSSPEQQLLMNQGNQQESDIGKQIRMNTAQIAAANGR